MRRGVRFPAWYLLLVAVLGILSGWQSLRDLQRFEKRHSASPMLALVQAKLARWAGLEAEATHYRSRAQKLAPDDPRILLEAVEAALGPHPALQELAAVLDA